MGWLGRLFFLRRGARPAEYRRILVLLLLPIGDTLFATPTIRALRRRYPRARIDALVYPTNAGILEGNPDLDRVFVYPTRQTWRGVAAYLQLLSELNGRRYDLGVEGGPYLWWLSTLCGIPYRLFLDMPIPYWFFPIGERPWSKRHAIANMASLVEPLGLLDVASLVDVSHVIVQPTAASRLAAERFLEEQELGRQTPILGLHPGGEGFRGLKRWGAAEFAETARVLAARHGARVLIFGGSDERELGNDVAARIGPEAIVLNGKVTLSVATALMERCFLFIGNDSAPMHMAAAVGTPTLGVFGPTNPTNYRPVGRHVAIVRSGIPCSPCFSFVGSTTLFGGSKCQDNHCLKELRPPRVIAAGEALLRRAGTLPVADTAGDAPRQPAAAQPSPAQVDALAGG